MDVFNSSAESLASIMMENALPSTTMSNQNSFSMFPMLPETFSNFRKLSDSDCLLYTATDVGHLYDMAITAKVKVMVTAQQIKLT
jgi:hypothetical protein